MKYNEEEEILELLNLFDRDYFHVCKQMEEGKTIYWEVYYKNLSGNNYYENDNKPILKKDKSSKEDIKKVLDEFMESKSQAKKNVLWDLFRQNHNFFMTNLKISDLLSKVETILSIVNLILVGLSYIIKKYDLVLILLNAYVITILCFCYFTEKIKDEMRKLENQEEEILIKNEMKYRKGNVYEYKKKSRKRTTKKDETKEGEI